jgi:hypothetical protein
MSRANPLWGAPRIHGELLKLGLAIAQRTVAKYMIPRLRRPPSQNWKTFLRNHLSSMVSVTEKRCWVEPSTADSSIRPRLGKARPTGPGPAASGVGTWISGSARAVGVARPESPRASSDGISARQRLGEARESANESCRGGFREIRQKPTVFSPDEILASDRLVNTPFIQLPSSHLPVTGIYSSLPPSPAHVYELGGAGCHW